MDDICIPSQIPWKELKGKELEELLYWLFSSMGAKNLEWRIGGKGDGTADQGRDLELDFYTSMPDGSLAKQHWWVEAKGRKSTLEAKAVHESVLNASGKNNIEILVIATNTNFSNPTRDWVKDWQKNNPRPIIKLWEKTELENLCCKNPAAVIRLYQKALTIQGKLKVVETKFWDYLSYSDNTLLEQLWNNIDELNITEQSLIALCSSEFANGDISKRSWGLKVEKDILFNSICIGFMNLMFLCFKANDVGVEQHHIIKSMSYLISMSLIRLDFNNVIKAVKEYNVFFDKVEYPTELKEYTLIPVLKTLNHEMEVSCSKDCKRISADYNSYENDKKEYWDRFISNCNIDSKKDNRVLVIYDHKEECKIGLPEYRDNGCPLFDEEINLLALEEFLNIRKRIIEYRIGI